MPSICLAPVDIMHIQKLIDHQYEPGMRLIEPHAVGRTKDGNLVLRAYQVSGASGSGEHNNWKLFRLDKVQAANDAGDEFDGPRSGYNAQDSVMKGGIIACL